MFALVAAAALAADLVVEADRLVLDGDRVVADGQVVIRMDALVVTARQLTAQDGRVHLTDARWVRATGGVVTAASAELLPGPLLVGEYVRYDACGCDPSPIVLDARHARVDADSVRLDRTAVRLFGVPVAWVPVADVPITRRSGFLAPDLGVGADGLRLAAPVYLTLGPSADVTLTPEVRTARGALLHAEGRYALRDGDGVVQLAGGRDATRGWRGLGTWSHLGGGDAWRAVTTGTWTSDEAFRADWATGWLDRSRPWDEARALVGVRRLEATAGALQHAGVVDQPLAGLAWRAPATDLPLGLLGEASIATGWTVRGATPWGPGTGKAHVGARARLSRLAWLGPVRAEVAVGGVAADSGTADGAWVPDGHAGARLDLTLPVWRASADGFTRVEPTVGVRARAGAPGSPVALAPGMRMRHTTAAATAELRGDLTLAPGTWRGRAVASLQTGPWEGRGQLTVAPEGRIPIAVASLSWRPDPITLSVGYTHVGLARLRGSPPKDAATAAVSLALPGPLSTVRVGASGAADRSGWRHRGATLGWTHPTGCLALGLDVRRDADRRAPDVGVRVDVSPN